MRANNVECALSAHTALPMPLWVCNLLSAHRYPHHHREWLVSPCRAIFASSHANALWRVLHPTFESLHFESSFPQSPLSNRLSRWESPRVRGLFIRFDVLGLVDCVWIDDEMIAGGLCAGDAQWQWEWHNHETCLDSVSIEDAQSIA